MYINKNKNRKPIEISKQELIKIIEKSPTVEEAAKVLGIDRKSLYHIRKKLGILHIPANRNGKNKTVNPKQFDIKEGNPNIKKVFDGEFKLVSDITHLKYKKFVITSVQNDTVVNKDFYDALKFYCKKHNAKLLITKVNYFLRQGSSYNVDLSDILDTDVQLSHSIKLFAEMPINPAITDPLGGLDPLCKGDSAIIPHPQVRMKTLPSLNDIPPQLYTTGSISEPCYTKTKQGYKADFNHSLAALVIELGNEDSFHARYLNCDENNGFYDIDGYYTKDSFQKLDRVEAIYLGDTHITVIDPEVVKATFSNEDSIINTLKPKTIIHGDILDTQSVSHHDNHDYLRQVAKYHTSKDKLEDELNAVGKFLSEFTPAATQVLILASNHNDHLYKWLTTTNIKDDKVNSKLYHFLNYLLIENIEDKGFDCGYPNVLELWLKNSKYSNVLEFCKFTGRKGGYRIKDIDVSMHGDKGSNGAKGSPKSFANLPTKTIVGHSHSPSIEKGCYTVGTSSRKNLSYTGGPSSWLHSHCIIYPNGKRQMINIINGKWRA